MKPEPIFEEMNRALWSGLPRMSGAVIGKWVNGEDGERQTTTYVFREQSALVTHGLLCS
jgi:hypothetical protein